MSFLNHFYNKNKIIHRYLKTCKYYSNIFLHKNILPFKCDRYLSLSSSSSLSESTSSSSENVEDFKIQSKSPSPVYEKFEKLLNDLTVKQGNDINFTTNFGSVRFDTDVDFTSNEKNILENEKIETTQNEVNYIENLYFTNTTLNHSHEIDKSYITSTSTELKNPDLNYVDEQYLKVGTLDENNSLTNYNSETKPDISSLNYIDSQIEGLSNQAIKENELKTSENKKLNHYYSFEDSVDETIEENFIIKENNDVIDNHKRETLECQLLSMTEKGSEYLDEFDKSQKVHKPIIFKTEKKVIEKKKDPVDFNEEDLQSKDETTINHKNNVRSAYSYVLEKRKEEMISSKKEIKGEILDQERYKKILLAIPSYSLHTKFDMAKTLKANIIYNEGDIVAISKPYGIPIHGGGDKPHERLNIVDLLPTLAELLKIEKLLPIHRLDMNVTGVLLLAKTDEMAEDLKKMFKERQVKKTYLAIVKGVPNPFNGIIDIPIGQGKVDKYERMVLRPDIPNFRGKPGKSKKAITRYKVLSTVQGGALIEVNPVTGIKHQIRVHLGFGINCPVIGDHKYSYLSKIVPQKLPGNLLHCFGMQQSKVRTLPMFLHSFSINLPIVDDKGREIFIRAIPPKHFRMALQTLKLSSRRNRLTTKYHDIIYGFE